MKPLMIRGLEVPVEVSETGVFSAVLNEVVYSADTYDGLRDKLMSVSRRAAVKVSVPFSLAEGSYGGSLYVRDGVATGIHQATEKILVRWEGYGRGGIGHTSQLTRNPDAMRRLDKAEVAELRRLHAAKLDADRAYRQFTEDHAMKPNLRTAVLNAIADQVAAQADPQ